MVAPGNVNPKGVQAPPPPGQGRQPIKAAGVVGPAAGLEGAYQGTPRTASATQHSTEVLHQRSKMPFCPARMALGGFAVAAVLGYFTLYSKKKPEATAVDVARVATGTATTENTRPRNQKKLNTRIINLNPFPDIYFLDLGIIYIYICFSVVICNFFFFYSF